MRRTITQFMLALRLVAVVMVMVAPLLITSCAGGSGSSGFDVSAGFENARIAQSLDEQRCVNSASLMICPADQESAATPGPNEPAGMFGDVVVVTGLTEQDGFRCSVVSDTAGGAEVGACRVDVVLHTTGLPDGALLQVAIRSAEPHADWLLVGAVSSGAGGDTVIVEVPVSYERVQIAVMVFSAGEPLTPGTLELLADSGADLVFVTPVLDVAITDEGA